MEKYESIRQSLYTIPESLNEEEKDQSPPEELKEILSTTSYSAMDNQKNIEEKSFRKEENSKFIHFLEGLLTKEKSIKCQIVNLMQIITTEAESIIRRSSLFTQKLKKKIKELKIKAFLNDFHLKSSSVDENFADEEDLNQFCDFLNDHKSNTNDFFKIDDNQVSFVLSELIQKRLNLEDEPRQELADFKEDFHDFIYYFENKTNILVGFDLESQVKTFYELKFLTNGMNLPCLLQINNDLLFIHEGRENSHKIYSKTIIFNIKNCSYKELEDGSPTSLARPVLFKNQVFLFGGSLSYGPISASQSFDLFSQNYKKITNLPRPVSNTSAVCVKNKILIAGQGHDSIFLYNPEEDNYEQKTTGIFISFRNVLFKYLETLFVVSENIYEANEENAFVWKVVGKSGINDGNIITNGVLRRDYLYFANWMGNVYRFDWKLKVIEVMKGVIG